MVLLTRLQNITLNAYSIDGAAAVTTAPAWLTIGETTGVWEFDPKHADFNTLAVGQSDQIEVTL